MKAKKEEAKELLKQVKKANLTAKERAFYVKHNFWLHQSGVHKAVFNQDQVDEKMIQQLGKKIDVQVIVICEPEDDVEL